MTRSLDISNYLYLANNTKQPVRESSNYKLCKLGIFLSFDEHMIGTKSRIAKKFGIKVWVLCEALSGYYFRY